MLRRSVLLVGIALAACRIEVSEPRGEAAANLTLDFLLFNAPGVSSVNLSARFWPGRDERGESRRVLADSLVAFGVSLAPERVGPGAMLYFSQTWPAAAAMADSPEPLVLPAADGLRPPPLTDGVPLVSTTAPDTLFVGEQLVLPLQPGPIAGEDDGSAVWTLEVTSPQLRRFTMNVAGVPPDTIRVPRSLLPHVADARLELQVSGSRRYELLAGDYDVRITQISRIARVLRFTDPAP